MKRVTDIDAFFGKKVKNRRLMLNLSQEALANKVGLTFQQIQKYEQGKNRISASRLYQFMKIMSVDASYFFEGIEEFDQTPKPKEHPVISASIADKIEKELPKIIKLYGSVHDHDKRHRIMETLRIWSED